MEQGRHRSGVGLVLSKAAQRALIEYGPISDRMLMARFKSFTGEMVVVQAYAPTTDSTEEALEDFYGDLQNTIGSVPSKSCLVLMGDFNAKVGDAQLGGR